MSKKGQKNVGGPNEMSENVKTYQNNVREPNQMSKKRQTIVRKKVGSPNEMSKMAKMLEKRSTGQMRCRTNVQLMSDVRAISVVQIRCQKMSTTCQKLVG